MTGCINSGVDGQRASKSQRMVLSQAVKDLKSAREFCKINAIEPTHIIILWEEAYSEYPTDY